MLHEFLRANESEILAMTEKKSLELAGIRPSSEQLKQGLPIFYGQLMSILKVARPPTPNAQIDKLGMANAARDSNESAMARAAGRPDEVEVANEAALHGTELLRLGYTLSHVVHAYGAMCQSITELASQRKIAISNTEFHDLNRCLDIAMAGAVTGFQSHRNEQESNREVERLGFLAHELRNALTAVNVALHLIKSGTVGFAGSTGQILDQNLKRIQDLIDRSLTEVRLSVDPKVHPELTSLRQMVIQIVEGAENDARSRKQVVEVRISAELTVEADQQLLYSALSNLIQNALKYTRESGKIEVRSLLRNGRIVIEVEDECGGLSSKPGIQLFKPFEQKHANRKGLGLGLAIARRAIELNQGTVDARDLPGKGCIFTITLPAMSELGKTAEPKPSAA